MLVKYSDFITLLYFIHLEESGFRWSFREDPTAALHCMEGNYCYRIRAKKCVFPLVWRPVGVLKL